MYLTPPDRVAATLRILQSWLTGPDPMVDPLPFATYSFVMSITPGPNNVMLTASGATFGFRRTCRTSSESCAGFSVVLFAVCAGLDVIFTRWPDIQTVLRWIGAAYLLYLGWRILRSGETQSRRAASHSRPWKRPYSSF